MNLRRQLAAILLLPISVSAPGCSKDAPLPNVILIVIDTARADHFSSYGYASRTTPHIDAFAADAVRFEKAYSTSTWTLPAHASLFTGLLPVTHGATQEHLFLDDRCTTLAEILSAHGYATGGFSGNPWVARRTNLARGFDVMEEMWGRPEAAEQDIQPHSTNRLIFDWLRKRDVRRPFFLFVNYIEPHFPYVAPTRYERALVPADATASERRAAGMSWVDWYQQTTTPPARIVRLRAALYDAELAFADAIVGELLDELKNMGLYENSAIVVTSDHGENLGDHGHLDHVFSLYNTTVHVPLFVRLPGAKNGGAVRGEPVQLTDLFATLTDIAGIVPSEPRVVGRNLFDRTLRKDRPILAEYYYPKQALGAFPEHQQSTPVLDRFRRRLRSVQVGTYKLIWGSDERLELYNLRRDPNEDHNVIGSARSVTTALRAQLESMVHRFKAGTPGPLPSRSLDAAAQERLRALGYLR